MVEARRLRPDLKVLLTSGYAITETPLADAGDKVPRLKKPYSLTELYHVLREVLGR